MLFEHPDRPCLCRSARLFDRPDATIRNIANERRVIPDCKHQFSVVNSDGAQAEPARLKGRSHVTRSYQAGQAPSINPYKTNCSVW